jgi:putative RNA 2'-phosphotransferase
MDERAKTRMSKLMSLALRHQPQALGLALDAQGWVAVDALLEGLRNNGTPLALAELQDIVATNSKRRFALSEDGQWIRASQGHSVAVDLQLEPCVPPERLYHGTVADALASIREHGLVHGSRQHVHLSADTETAMVVARRRRGPHVILSIDALRFHAEGGVFFLSANGVWLSERIPAGFIRFPPTR